MRAQGVEVKLVPPHYNTDTRFSSTAIHRLVDLLNERVHRAIQVKELSFLHKGNSFENIVLTTDQQAYILKILKPGRNKNIIVNSVQALQLCEQHNICAPHYIYHSFAEDLFGSPYLVLSFFMGEDFEEVVMRLPEKKQIRCFQDLAVYLKKLHSIIGPCHSPDLLMTTHFSSWKEFLFNRLNREMKTLRDMQMYDSAPLQSLHSIFVKQIESLSDTIHPSFVHRDIHPANIIVQHGSFLCLVDFEIAWYSDPLWDFNKLNLFGFPSYPYLKNALFDCYNTGIENFDLRIELYKGFEYLWALRSYHADDNQKVVLYYKDLLEEWLRRTKRSL